MKIICRLLLAMACLCLANISWATVCANSTGVAEDEHYDLSNVFNSTNNQPGQIVVLPEKSGWVGVSAICPPGTLVNYTYRSYVTNFIVQETIDNYKYMKLNDYLLGAMSLVDSVMDIQFPPQNYIRMGTDPNVSQNLPFGVMDSRLIFRLKVIRPFINMVEIPRQVMFTVYVTSTPYDPLVTPVYTISFGGRVEVPQNCELNAGQIVEFDFGDIGASLFSAAGPGNRPAGVMPQTKSIAVKCTNVAAQAYLTMRLEASAVSGQAMVSDNQDLGFIVADQNDTPIRTIRRSRLTISIALFLSVWMQLRQPMSHFAPGLSVLPVKNRPRGRLARWGIYASIINEVRRMRRVLFSCFCGLLWSSSGWAVDPLGTININLHGNVVDFSCTVNTADIDKTVDLGRWPTTQLLNAGDTTALVPFSLRLEGCPPGSVAILFTGTPASDANLLALDDPAMAQTVAIELRNSDRSRLALGEASPTEEVDANGNVTLNFFANYRALASGVRPGVAKADAIFMINYN